MQSKSSPTSVAPPGLPRRVAWTRYGSHLGLTLFGLMAGVAGAEVLLRTVSPDETFGAARELPWMRATHGFTIDPAFGFRPVFGRDYQATGTRRNAYSQAKADSVERVLYIGDSVTRRGRIVRALESVYGDTRYEFWNAGVESFNTVQEVEYYRRYNRPLRPDHIILTFHNNDFGTTPVTFRDDRGRLVVYEPGTPELELSPLLFRYSMIYRLIVGFTLNAGKDDIAYEDEVRDALRQLKRMAASDGARLTVLVLPILKEFGTWSPEERRRHAAAIRILRDLDIRHYDLLPPLERALELGVDPMETPGDPWHPSDDVAAFFASYLSERGVL